MSGDIDSRSLVFQPAIYRICVCGPLGLEWSDRLGGMNLRIRKEKGGDITTVLSGRLPDQAALMGVL